MLEEKARVDAEREAGAEAARARDGQYLAAEKDKEVCRPRYEALGKDEPASA